MFAGKVGVLALQGDVSEHRNVLEALGAQVVEVRDPQDLAGVDAMVIPGGESTTMSKLMVSSGLVEPIAAAISDGMPVLGTCAGMILLARQVMDGRDDQVLFGAIDIAVRRNAFGRQVASFETDVEVAGVGGGPFHAVFIRAPLVEQVGPEVEVLGALDDGTPVVCRQGKVVACSFHPELTGDDRLHAMVLSF
jgi:5'-phosphate synthase pdxT subunit